MKKPRIVSTAFSTYVVGKKLGEGGSGVVYEAADEDFKLVAIKFLKPDRAKSKDARKRFKNEVLFCSRTDHPHVVKVLESGIHEDESPFFVMPRYFGSVRNRMKELAPPEKMDVFLKILDGVEAAHLTYVLHRDLKPENVLCSEDMREIAVTDFGIARFDNKEIYTAVETKHKERLANFKYRAPEQLEKDGKVAEGTDIFALGLMLNEFFTGRIPVGTKYMTIASVSPEYAYLDPIVEKMIDQDIDQRFPTIDEIKREIIKQSELQVSRQKLDELNRTVVTVETPTDPLVDDPIKIISFDYAPGVMTVFLNRKVTPEWLRTFQDIQSRSHTYSSTFIPSMVTFSGDKAQAPSPANFVQSGINFLKGWITNTNHAYETKVKRELEEAERALRSRLEEQRRAEEVRQQVLSTVKF